MNSKIIIGIKNKKVREEIEKKYFQDKKIIFYKEAILEILEENKNINKIFISENLEGEINLLLLIKQIKKINNKIQIIIILLKENNKLKSELIKLGIKDIYLENKNKSKIIHVWGGEYEDRKKFIEKEIDKTKNNTNVEIMDFNKKQKNKNIYYLLVRNINEKKYDYIYINNYSNVSFNFLIKIIKLSQKNYYLMNFEINKIIEEKNKINKIILKISKDKFKIIINKKINNIDDKIISNIFYPIKIKNINKGEIYGTRIKSKFTTKYKFRGKTK